MELPTIAKSTYGASASALSAADLMLGNVAFGGAPNNGVQTQDWHDLRKQLGVHRAFEEDVKLSAFPAAKPKEKFVSRIVRVFIADPNESLPLDKRILYKSEEFHTDLTDQELFFEANPAAMLAKHNEYRITVMDKKLSNPQREVKLEPARIRDLKMVVVDVATF